MYKSNRDRAENSFGMQYGIGGFFQLEPLDTLLPDTAMMTIIYTDSMVMDIDETSLGMYKEAKLNHSWIYIGGVVDTALNMVTAPITDLALYTLAPTMPLGAFNIYPATDSLYADSISTTIVTSNVIYYNNTDTVSDGELFTVNTESGTIITLDADTIDGIQVEAVDGMITFTLKSSHIGGQPRISAASVYGSAKADTNIVFYDTIAPAAPVGLAQQEGNEKVYLTWSHNPEEDLAGYIIYFDYDTIEPPYEGTSTVYGFPSPIVIGVDSSYVVTGLWNDTTYYFTITAFDVNGNESDYSEVITATPLNFRSQQVDLLQGWNICSFNVEPDYMQTDSIFKVLKDSAILVKAIDENGGFIQNIPGIGWLNTIGNMSPTEGYYVKLNQPASITLDGIAVSIPFIIPLSTGWNIMGYPLFQEQDAMTALQTLIDNEELVKIIDETGGFIQNIPGIGWLNTIGNFEPGEGYYIKVNVNTNIVLDNSTSKSGFVELPLQTPKYFTSCFENNPYYPMNILVTDISVEGIEVKERDEIGIYDGDLCVGAGIIHEQDNTFSASIIVSMEDPLTDDIDGYIKGNALTAYYWNEQNGDRTLLKLVDLYGNRSFEPLSTYVCTPATSVLSDDELMRKYTSIACYPNPVKDNLTVLYNIPVNGNIRIEIHNIYGNLMGIIYEGLIEKGVSQVNYNLNSLVNGVYLISMKYRTKHGYISLQQKIIKQ